MFGNSSGIVSVNSKKSSEHNGKVRRTIRQFYYYIEYSINFFAAMYY